MTGAFAIDFETFWDSKSYTLAKMGPIEYVRDPRFEAQLLAVAPMSPDVGDIFPEVCDTPERIREKLSRFDPETCAFVGHNISGFDALILSERYGIRPKHVWDTIAMAHWTGISRIASVSHASVTKLLENGVKEQGTVVSDGKRWPDDFSESERDFFRKYCFADAVQCGKNFFSMLPYMTSDALRFMEITARMATDPGFVLDRERLESCRDRLASEAQKAMTDLARMFGFGWDSEEMRRAVRSPARFAGMLRALGVEPPVKVSLSRTKTTRRLLEYNLRKANEGGDARRIVEAQSALDTFVPVLTYAFSKTDLDFVRLSDHDDPRVRALVCARLDWNSSVMQSRTDRLLRFSQYGRPIPIMLSAYKAHTSRYTAGNDMIGTDGLQFQNLSKRDPSKLELRRAIRVPSGHKVVACDSSQIEARVLAYIANETDLLDQFREGRDPYAELAAKIFHVSDRDIHDGAKSGDKTMKLYRNVGKTCVLSAGYQVGARKFSDTLLRQGVRLDPDDGRHAELAHSAHAVYRASNPMIVAFWRRCQGVIEALSAGYSGKFGGPDGDLFEFGPMRIACLDVTVPSIRLPSGFILRYPDLREGIQDDGRSGYTFSRPVKGGEARIKIYGGLLCENLSQSFAFQILMWQACRMDERGVRLHANVHDSFASVVPAADVPWVRQTMTECMSLVPPWASGCPLACEAEIGEDFTIV